MCYDPLKFIPRFIDLGFSLFLSFLLFPLSLCLSRFPPSLSLSLCLCCLVFVSFSCCTRPHSVFIFFLRVNLLFSFSLCFFSFVHVCFPFLRFLSVFFVSCFSCFPAFLSLSLLIFLAALGHIVSSLSSLCFLFFVAFCFCFLFSFFVSSCFPPLLFWFPFPFSISFSCCPRPHSVFTFFLAFSFFRCFLFLLSFFLLCVFLFPSVAFSISCPFPYCFFVGALSHIVSSLSCRAFSQFRALFVLAFLLFLLCVFLFSSVAFLTSFRFPFCFFRGALSHIVSSLSCPAFSHFRADACYCFLLFLSCACNCLPMLLKFPFLFLNVFSCWPRLHNVFKFSL